MKGSPAFTEAWRLLQQHSLVTVPLVITRDSAGKKQLQPLPKFGHLWDAEPTAAVDELWGGREDAPGLAVLLTKHSAMFALDTDSAEATDWAFELLGRTRTPTIASRRGFKWLLQLDGLDLSSSSGAVRADVDIKAPNALVVIPPTDGYAWQASLSFDDVPLAPVPEGLEKILRRQKSRPRVRVELGADIPPGEAHDTMLRIIGKLARTLSPEELWVSARALNQGRLPEDELRAIVEDVVSKEHPKSEPARAPTGTADASGKAPPVALEDVVAGFRESLYLPDATPLLGMLGTAAANLLDDDPVWMLLVGASSGGKTVLLDALLGLRDVFEVGTLTEGALLSGTSAKEQARGAKGGLLRELGDFGILVCKDFTSVLSMSGDARMSALAALREIYDGHWTRWVGTDGGRKLEWRGKVGFVGGCTSVYDRYHAVTGVLGERFLLCRLPDAEVRERPRQTLTALHRGRKSATLARELAESVRRLFEGAHGERAALDDDELLHLAQLADFAALCRSPVIRDGYKRTIVLVPQPEVGTRLALQLRALIDGLAMLGATRRTAWTVAHRIALDSMPAIRRRVLQALTDECSTPELADATGLSGPAARETLEDLAAHRLVYRTARGAGRQADRWRLDEWARERLAVCERETAGRVE